MYAGTFKRVAAYILDYIIIYGASSLILMMTDLMSPKPLMQRLLDMLTNTDPSALQMTTIWSMMIPYMIIPLFFYLLYEILFTYSSLSATPGKIIMGMEIVCYDKASLVKVVLRAFTKIFFMLTNIYVIEFIMIMCTEKKQSLHDMIAQTYVYDTSRNSGPTISDREALLKDLEHKQGITYDDLTALHSQLPSSRKSSSGSGLGKGLSWLAVVLALVMSGAYYVVTFSSAMNYAPSVSVSTDMDSANVYVGKWSGDRVSLDITYKGSQMLIADKSRVFTKFFMNDSYQLCATDRRGRTFVFIHDGKNLVGTYTETLSAQNGLTLTQTTTITLSNASK